MFCQKHYSFWRAFVARGEFFLSAKLGEVEKGWIRSTIKVVNTWDEEPG